MNQLPWISGLSWIVDIVVDKFGCTLQESNMASWKIPELNGGVELGKSSN